jgi:NitT/TauT family transport system substrate-binding protein
VAGRAEEKGRMGVGLPRVPSGIGQGARRAFRGAAALVVLSAVGCGGAAPAAKPPPAAAPPAASSAAAPAAPVASGAAPARPAAPTAPPPVATVRLGALGSVTDAGFFIGLDRGYFKEQGLDLDLIPFDSGARMVAPLGAGQLEVGGGSHSTGLFNAIARNIDIRLVADKGSAPPGYGFQALLFRKDLVDSGQLRTPADLRGMRIGISARGTSGEPDVAAYLQPYGMTLDDVEMVELAFPEHAAAFAGRTLDASMNIEPFVTFIADQGTGTIYERLDTFVPGEQIAEVIYSGQFAQEQPDAARRFMVAYLRAVRDYNDAFSRGDTAKRQQIVTTLTQHTTVKDPALYDRMAMPGLDPDGRINMARVAAHQDFWVATGQQQARVNLDTVIDPRFADAAAQTLGPYR